MNNIVRKAVAAVNQLDTLAVRLGGVPVSEATRLVQLQEDNAAFLAAVNQAQTAVEAAMDELDGPALTAFDNGLHALRSARSAYYKPVDTNRSETATLVRRARDFVQSGSRG
jgi:hypothetical protein